MKSSVEMAHRFDFFNIFVNRCLSDLDLGIRIVEKGTYLKSGGELKPITVSAS